MGLPPSTYPSPPDRFPSNAALLASWSSGDACSDHWVGITCDGGGSVVRLQLTYIGLRGTIPSEVGALSSLSVMELRFTSLSGTLPPSLGRLTALVQLGLGYNSFSGQLPSELFLLTRLSGSLELFNNPISGTLPCQVRGRAAWAGG